MWSVVKPFGVALARGSLMTEMKDQSVQMYLEQLASRQATPGGGSAAALLGAQGAALVSMVCHLTIGKPKYAEVDVQMQAVLAEAERLREALTAMIQADIRVFNDVMACYALPKATEQDKQKRADRIQAVLKQAIEVPVACAHACAEVIALASIAAEIGSIAVISDAGVAVMSAYAGFKSAALNVDINAAALKDAAFAASRRHDIECLSEGMEAKVGAVYSLVKSRL